VKKFEFSLNRMRDYKERILEREKNVLSRLRAEKRRIDERIQILEDERARLEQTCHAQFFEGTTARQLQSLDFQKKNIRNQLETLHNEQRLAAAAVEKQLQVVLRMSQEVAGLDKLEEKQLEEYRTAQAKARENTVSELVASRFIRTMTANS
jgi:flagellar export protein FliJ